MKTFKQFLTEAKMDGKNSIEFESIAGGSWGNGSYCGSRARLGSDGRSSVAAYIGCRGKSPNINQA